jgi:hypothetical protein
MDLTVATDDESRRRGQKRAENRLSRRAARRYRRAVGWQRREERGMAGKSDALKTRYERFSRGDLEGALDLWSDDFVWEGANASDLPGSGRHEGSRQRSRSSSRRLGRGTSSS